MRVLREDNSHIILLYIWRRSCNCYNGIEKDLEWFYTPDSQSPEC